MSRLVRLATDRSARSPPNRVDTSWPVQRGLSCPDWPATDSGSNEPLTKAGHSPSNNAPGGAFVMPVSWNWIRRKLATSFTGS